MAKEKIIQKNIPSLKFKLLIGITIPLIIILILAIVSNMDAGLEIENTNIESIDWKILNNSYNIIGVYNIAITNNFLIPRKYELPDFIACLNDKNGINPRFSLEVLYSEGTYNRLKGHYEFDKTFFGINHYEARKTIDLSINQEKTIKVNIRTPLFLEGISPYTPQLSTSPPYNEILLIEVEDSAKRGYSCYSLSQEEIDNAIKIKIN